MRINGRWLAAVALVLSGTIAAAYAGDNPLPTRSLEMWVTGDGGAQISFNGREWDAVREADVTDGLKLVYPTWIRGPVRIRVIAGTFIDVSKGGVARLSWVPMVRGWRIESLSGVVELTTSNRTIQIASGRAVTLTTLDIFEVYPGGRDRGLEGLPPVSGFQPFDDPVVALPG